MRIVYIIMGLAGTLGGAVRIAAGEGRENVFEALFSILFGIVMFSLVGVVNRLEALSERLARLEEAGQDSEPAVTRFKAATPGPEINTSAEEARALFGSAQQHHFSKRFHDAREVYRELVVRFPESKQAQVAHQQLENLNRA